MNPYFAYSISFIVAMAVYSLGWSEAYPPFSIQLFGFLSVTILCFVVIGVYWQKKLKVLIVNPPIDTNAIRITVFIFLLWAADFIYEGGIPLFKILLSQPFDYRSFGIPSLHVFIVTFSSFYTIYLFHLYLSARRKLFLWLYIINLSAAFLIFNRGMFLFNLLASIFLFVNFKPRISRHAMVVAPLLFVLIVYLFGVFGNLRVSHGAQKYYDSSIFLKTGEAITEFKNSPIPNEFFWAYIYTSSSLANLQENINHAERHSLSLPWFLKMINNEMLFDFISKRINLIAGIPHPGEYTINGSFNVSTVYSVAFSHLSWSGMAIMACYIILVPLLYRKLLPVNSSFTGTALAILATLYLFMAFDNTISFTGLSFPLVYPLLFGWMEVRGIFALRNSASHSSNPQKI